MRAPLGSSAGYSLLELMVVLGILALIAVVAVPAMSGSIERMTLAGDARDLATQLRTLRENALDQQTEVEVTLSGSEANALTASSGDIIRLSTGTSIEVVAASKGVARFVISADGIAIGGFRLSRGASSSRIAVDRLTGRISIEAGR